MVMLKKLDTPGVEYLKIVHNLSLANHIVSDDGASSKNSWSLTPPQHQMKLDIISVCWVLYAENVKHPESDRAK